MTTLGHMTPHGRFLVRCLNVREAAETRYIRPKNDSVRNMPGSGARANPPRSASRRTEANSRLQNLERREKGVFVRIVWVKNNGFHPPRDLLLALRQHPTHTKILLENKGFGAREN